MAYASTKKPYDLVISTNKQYTVRKFVEISCKALNLNIIWKNKGLKEVGILKSFDKKRFPNLKKNKIIIKIDKKYYRPTEVENLKGDSSLAKRILGWKPKISFQSMVKEMIEEDLYLSKIELKKNDIKKDRIFVAGHNGMVGSAIVKCLKKINIKI